MEALAAAAVVLFADVDVLAAGKRLFCARAHGLPGSAGLRAPGPEARPLRGRRASQPRGALTHGLPRSQNRYGLPAHAPA